MIKTLVLLAFIELSGSAVTINNVVGSDILVTSTSIDDGQLTINYDAEGMKIDYAWATSDIALGSSVGLTDMDIRDEHRTLSLSSNRVIKVEIKFYKEVR